jgi:hypothetical protein
MMRINIKNTYIYLIILFLPDNLSVRTGIRTRDIKIKKKNVPDLKILTNISVEYRDVIVIYIKNRKRTIYDLGSLKAKRYVAVRLRKLKIRYSITMNSINTAHLI